MELSSSESVEGMAPHPALDRYYSGSKRNFVRKIFDEGADDYERIERMMAWGRGSMYRREALLRGGLSRGMSALDVGVGTGLVAREAMAITGDQGKVLGLDPSAGMLAQARRALNLKAVMGVAERLPLEQGLFDFVSMGYALRHVSDLNLAFAEFFRVLRAGGRVCILELTRPQGRIKTGLLGVYMGGVVPLAARLLTGGGRSRLLWRYYWETIASCVEPERVLEAMSSAGFVEVRRHTQMGIFSEYTGLRPLGPY